MSIKARLISFLKGFGFAFRGILSCIKSERNMRVHLCEAFYVIIFMRFYDLTAAEKAVVFLTIGAVIGFEIVNTSIETCVDLISPQYNALAQKAKDAAAGAVLCIDFFAAVIGLIFLWDTAVFKLILKYFQTHVLSLIGFLVSIVLWLIYIFSADATKKVTENKKKEN